MKDISSIQVQCPSGLSRCDFFAALMERSAQMQEEQHNRLVSDHCSRVRDG